MNCGWRGEQKEELSLTSLRELQMRPSAATHDSQTSLPSKSVNLRFPVLVFYRRDLPFSNDEPEGYHRLIAQGAGRVKELSPPPCLANALHPLAAGTVYLGMRGQPCPRVPSLPHSFAVDLNNLAN